MKSFVNLTLILGAVLGATILLATSPAHALMREMDPANDPGIFYRTYDANIQTLARSGSTNAALWSDTYWPSRFGGAAWRWQISQQPGVHPEADPHNYRTSTAAEVEQMSDDQLNQLSPAEKLDIAMGNFNYPTVTRERARTSPDLPKWHGLCHAVAAVTSRYQEPQNNNVVVTLPSGQQRNLMFWASDTKALLALAADKSIASGVGLGKTCTAALQATSACWDTNPASFYIVLGNRIGNLKLPLIMDVDPGVEVWNTVIKDYSAVVTDKDGINPNAAQGTVREVHVDMKVRHTLGAKPTRSAVGVLLKTENYEFTLELDGSDNIIGGEWISTNRPDSLWVTGDDMRLDGHFSFLQQLTIPLQ